MAAEIFEALAEQLGAAGPSRSALGLIQQLKPPSRDVAQLWAHTVLTLVGLRILTDQQALALEQVISAASADALRLRLVDSEKSSILRERLGRLLALRSVVVTSKAFDLATEYEHPFMDARILTDIRTVFDPQSEKVAASAGALIIHVLKLRDTAGSEYFMSLGRNDLRKLQSLVERALLKEQELRNRLAKAELQCLDEVEITDEGESE